MNWQKIFTLHLHDLLGVLAHQLSFACIYLQIFCDMISCQPVVVWTNSNVVSTWSAGASSISRQQQWQTDSNFWQYNLLTTNLTLQSFLFCSFLVPFWFMCLTCYMLPLRQEQLTASLTTPQVPKMTQSNRIRVCVWGGGCFCACVCEGTEEASMKNFFNQFVSEDKKGVAARVGWCLGSCCCCNKQDRGWGWDRDLRGWFTAVWHNGICAQSWNLNLGSALIKPFGIKPYYSAVKCQKTSRLPQWDYVVLYLVFS